MNTEANHSQVKSSSFFTILIGLLVVCVIGGIVLFAQDREINADLRVTGMSCEGCVASVKQALKQLPECEGSEYRISLCRSIETETHGRRTTRPSHRTATS